MERIIQKFSECFYSPNELDSNMETANIVDAICRLSRSIFKLAEVIDKNKEESK